MNSETNRRKFLRSAAVVSIGLPTLIPASALGRNGSVAPSNRIVVGGIGVGRRGQKVLDSFLQQKDAQFVAVADPQKARRELIKSQADKHYGNRDCAIYDETILMQFSSPLGIAGMPPHQSTPLVRVRISIVKSPVR